MDFFANLTKAPDDPILHLIQEYKKDPNPSKVDLSVGAYYNAEGKAENLESVNLAQKALAQYYYSLPTENALAPVDLTLSSKVAKDINISYLPSTGYKGFNLAFRDFVFPESLAARKANRIRTVETIAGSGGLRLVGEFLKQHLELETIYISNPTWSNHFAIFETAGLKTAEYRYYNAQQRGIDFAAVLEDLEKLTSKDAVLLQAACHNPTGYDFSPEQWKEVLTKIKEKGAFPVFDFAYQGFGAGLDEDAYSVRLATEIFEQALIISSCSKNFGLYGDRTGAIHILAANEKDLDLVVSNLQFDANNFYVSPGNNGAFIVATILKNPDLYALWVEEVAQIRARIASMRQQLADLMAAQGFDFNFVVQQKGMFSYTGFTSQEVNRLKDEFSIYIVSNGRMNIAGLNEKNIDYVAKAFAKVLADR
ncbi:amino acid aminotransferase [Psittacicella hinzii]|uniref:Aminotransferase class I/classII large domain-containing protein n=1 Tax=Psittacicella hinzii TaxID=2028575 RepID=A0A3A1YPR5_9GAMM|nr:aromatic amino acid transaminase [Psittacicella hinzii]RIY40182.1 hypothetical protein CKF58_00950 [Psittacicella hinzii]